MPQRICPVLDADLSGSGCRDELFVTCKGTMSGDFKEGGDDVELFNDVHLSLFGRCFFDETECGVCALKFAKDSLLDVSLTDFRQRRSARCTILMWAELLRSI